VKPDVWMNIYANGRTVWPHVTWCWSAINLGHTMRIKHIAASTPRLLSFWPASLMWLPPSIGNKTNYAPSASPTVTWKFSVHRSGLIAEVSLRLWSLVSTWSVASLGTTLVCRLVGCSMPSLRVRTLSMNQVAYDLGACSHNIYIYIYIYIYI